MIDLVKHEKQFYKIALKRNKLTKDQVLVALKHQKQQCPEKHIGEVFLEQKLLKEQELIELLVFLFRYELKNGLDSKTADQQISSYFFENQIITSPQLQRCYQQQADFQKEGNVLPLWQVMISLGVLDLIDLLQYHKSHSLASEEEQEEDLEKNTTRILDKISLPTTSTPIINTPSEETPKTKKIARPSRVLGQRQPDSQQEIKLPRKTGSYPALPLNTSTRTRKKMEIPSSLEEKSAPDSGPISPNALQEALYYFCVSCKAAYEKAKLVRGKKYRCKNCGEVFELLEEHADTLRHTENALQREMNNAIPKRYATSSSLTATSSGEEELFNKYEVLGQIAEGAMGIVYKARQIELNRLVALKVLKDTYSSHLGQVKRFKRESESAAALRHPNIVTIYESGSAGDCYYYTMEYIEGEPLITAIRDRKIPLKKQIAILLEICEGIAYAHSQGLIHRDIKPANILLDRENHPKITDFGLVKTLTKEQTVLSLHGQAIGTPNYMPPEQAKGDLNEIDERSDVYALGVLLYEMVTKRVPFTGKSNVEIYRQIIEEDPKEPRSLNKNCPKELNAICLKALQKEKHKRYQKATELANDLRAYLEDKPIEASMLAVKMQGKMFRLFKKHLAFIILTSVFLISLIAIVIYYQNRVLNSNHSQENHSNQNHPNKTPQKKEDLSSANIHLLDEALVYWDHFLLEEASQKLEEFLRQGTAVRQSDLLKAYLYTGMIQYYQRQFASAQSRFERVLEQERGNHTATFFVGACYLRQRELDVAINWFDRAIELAQREGKQSPEYFYYRALAYYQKDEFFSASTNCEQAIRLDPNYFMALCSKGLINLRMKRYSEAQSDFDKAINVCPEYSLGYLLRSLIDMRNRTEKISQDQAYNFLEKIQDTHLHFISHEFATKDAYRERYFRGEIIDLDVYKNYVQGVNEDEFRRISDDFRRIMFGQKPTDPRFEEKLRAYARLQINTSVFEYYLYRDVLPQKDVFKKIRNNLTVVLGYQLVAGQIIQELSPRILFYRALCYIEEEDFKLATEQIDAFLVLDRFNPNGILLKAWIFALKKDIVKSENIYNELDPYLKRNNSFFSSKVSFQRAYLAYLKHDLESAQKHFKAALDQQPKNSEAYYYRAKSMIELGPPNQIPSAISDLKNAAKFHPYYTFIFKEIQTLQEKK